MTWNHDITAAPRGQTITITRKVKTADGIVDREVEEFRSDDVIIETKCGKVIKSYWLPKEDRWAGLAKGEQPVAWQPWPTPSGGAPVLSSLDALNHEFVTALDTVGGE